MNDHQQWEEDVRARRNLILAVAGAAILALALVLFWLSATSNEQSAVSPEEAEAVAAAEGEQAQPTLPDEAPPTVTNTAPDPNFDQRTLPARVPTVASADDPAANRPAQTGERVVIGGDMVDQFERAQSAPDGWSYLPEFGASSIFRLQPNGDGQNHTVMLANTRQDAGVLQKEVDVALDPDTSLRWQWNMVDLPSDRPEDTAATHDYFSIAVKFDNGQDLTYMWSSDLLDGTSFRCPLPEWNERETHVVVRSGEMELNQWLREERSILADYQRYIGGELPGRITHVWLIASSAIQSGQGRAVFMDISIGGERQRTTVL